MNIYEVQPIFSHPTHPFELTIDAPGSKSITNRALMLAALANGETLLKGALFSDDSRHFLQCLKDLGFDVVVDEPAHVSCSHFRRGAFRRSGSSGSPMITSVWRSRDSGMV